MEEKERTIKITIPAGVDNDSVLPLRGQGHAGSNGGASGDILVYINVQEDPIFKRRGDDIYVELPISFMQAALGDNIEVPTIDGKVKMKIPEGTQTGKEFRMRGKGVKNVNGYGRGDQYVTIRVETPQKLTRKQKELMRKFGESLTNKNHQKGTSFWDRVKGAM